MSSVSPSPRNRSLKTPNDYLDELDPTLLESLTPIQRQAVVQLLERAIPKPSPKLVDLRFGIDLILTRFYIVLMIGRDRRKQHRYYQPSGKVAQVGNWITIVLLLLGLNLTLSGIILLALYLIKSAVGLDFMPGHISETLKRVLQP